MHRLLLLLCGLSVAAAQERPDQAALDEVSRLGRQLYGVDQAAWHGTDAVMPLMERDGAIRQDGTGPVRGYVAKPAGSGWLVAFGRLNADSSAFHVAYEASLDSTHAVTDVRAYSEPKVDTGFYRDASLGVAAAIARFAFQNVTYNFPVLPGPDGTLYVYVIPAQPAIDVYYLGGDARFSFDPKTSAVVETPLHASMMTMDLREPGAGSSFSSAVLTEIPTETDVFYALSRPRPVDLQAPHYVMTQDWVFLIGHSGEIIAMASDVFRSLSTNDGETLSTTDPDGH